MTTVANIIDAVEARIGNAITATSDFNEDQCFLWIDDACEDILKLLVEYDSELGRTIGSITTVDGTAIDSTLTLILSTAQYGWILKTNERIKIELVSEEKSIDFDPSFENEPEYFFLDENNYINFLPTPDDEYTVKIPYWKQHTIITSNGNTVPFHGVFDRVIIETIIIRYQNREEYEVGYEAKWLSYLRNQAKKIILLRKGHRVEIG